MIFKEIFRFWQVFKLSDFSHFFGFTRANGPESLFWHSKRVLRAKKALESLFLILKNLRYSRVSIQKSIFMQILKNRRFFSFFDLRRPGVKFSNYFFWRLLRGPKSSQSKRNRVGVRNKNLRKPAKKKFAGVLKGPQNRRSRSRMVNSLNRLNIPKNLEIRRQRP